LWFPFFRFDSRPKKKTEEEFEKVLKALFYCKQFCNIYKIICIWFSLKIRRKMGGFIKPYEKKTQIIRVYKIVLFCKKIWMI
jgi:hypothetical protein